MSLSLRKRPSCYLYVLPKDVLQIVYRYLYEDVPSYLHRYVVKYSNVKKPRNYYVPDSFDINSSLLKSTVCKVCRLNDDETLCVWIRDNPKNYNTDILKILSEQSKNSVCACLMKSQDVSKKWNKSFKSTHRYSIINGVVYHLVDDDYDTNDYSRLTNKCRLVPYFQSDHCWQDLAVRHMRNNNYDNDECVRKQAIVKKDTGCLIS